MTKNTLIKAGLRLITRLNLGANHSSNMLLIETLMKLFFGSIDLDLAATTWSLLVKLSNSDSACYALIVRKTIETLRRISQPPVPTCKKQENTSLLDQVGFRQKNNFQEISFNFFLFGKKIFFALLIKKNLAEP